MKIRNCLLLICFLNTAHATTVKNETQVSIIQTGGNSVAETYSAKTLTVLNTEHQWLYTFSGHYNLSRYKDNGDRVNIESVRNWSVALKPEREFGEKLSIFSQIQYEGNKFSGYSQRDNFDIGAKYKMINTLKKKFSLEIGYRYTVERKFDTVADVDSIQHDNKARLYTEYQLIPNKSLSYKFWLEYLPNFTTKEDYLIKFEPSVSIILTNMFSLNFAYNGTYDNSPAIDGNEYLDFTYTTSIIAKY
jgi:putative salt-induced outer membrane protein